MLLVIYCWNLVCLLDLGAQEEAFHVSKNFIFSVFIGNKILSFYISSTLGNVCNYSLSQSVNSFVSAIGMSDCGAKSLCPKRENVEEFIRFPLSISLMCVWWQDRAIPMKYICPLKIQRIELYESDHKGFFAEIRIKIVANWGSTT